MKNSRVLKWTSSSKGSKVSNGKTKDSKGNEKQWIHSPDSLLKSSVIYLVKFMGKIDVDKQKGIDVVKEAIQRMKFSQQLKKSEGGTSSPQKLPKVELSISVNGVTILDPKNKEVQHEYPLHRISYCADDKNEKRFFSFIAKESETSSTHVCFVFISDKLAEEITLTIGQAFELGYKQYLSATDKEKAVQKQLKELRIKISALDYENLELKKRLNDVASFKSCHQDVLDYLANKGIKELCVVDQPAVTAALEETTEAEVNSSASADTSGDQNQDESTPSTSNVVEELICLDNYSPSSSNNEMFAKFEGFSFDDDADFDPRNMGGTETQSVRLKKEDTIPSFFSTAPVKASNVPPHGGDVGTSVNPTNPFKTDLVSNDPFGMQSFTVSQPFSFEDIDPLRK